MPNSISKVLNDAIQAADLLADYHAQGHIHGSLNPEAFSRDASGDICALSPMQSESSAPSDAVARLRYLSPEQAGRLTDRISEQSDLYALGVILYQWLTGAPPFDFSDPLSLVHHHLAVAPIPPSAYRKDLPPLYRRWS